MSSRGLSVFHSGTRIVKVMQRSGGTLNRLGARNQAVLVRRCRCIVRLPLFRELLAFYGIASFSWWSDGSSTRNPQGPAVRRMAAPDLEITRSR